VNDISDENVVRVDTFIERLHNGDLVIRPQNNDDRNIAEGLSQIITIYLEENEPSKKIRDADDCLYWINSVFINGIVHEGEGLISKIKECKESIAQLEEVNSKLQEENNKLHEQYSKLKRDYDKLKKDTIRKFGGGRSLGDVVGR